MHFSFSPRAPPLCQVRHRIEGLSLSWAKHGPLQMSRAHQTEGESLAFLCPRPPSSLKVTVLYFSPRAGPALSVAGDSVQVKLLNVTLTDSGPECDAGPAAGPGHKGHSQRGQPATGPDRAKAGPARARAWRLAIRAAGTRIAQAVTVIRTRTRTD